MSAFSCISQNASVLIAFLALVVTFFQAFITRRHNKLSVRPHLTTWESFNAQNGLHEIELRNQGIGPALVKRFQVFVDGRPIDGNGSEQITQAAQMLFPGSSYTLQVGYVGNGYSMMPNEKILVASIRFAHANYPSSEAMRTALSRVRLTIEYHSMYEESFVLDTALLKEQTDAHKAALPR